MAAAGSDALIQKLEAQVRAEAVTILAAAGQEVARIRATSDEERASATANAVKSCGEEVAERNAQRLAEARAAARRSLLEAQHHAVSRVLAEVPRIAAGMKDAIGDDAFAARIAEVRGYAGAELEEIKCAPALFARLAALMESVAGVRVCPDASIAAGVRAFARAGQVVVDDTIEAWLAQEHPRLTIRICRELGEGGGT